MKWQLRAEILIRVFRSSDGEKNRVKIQAEDVDFENLMCATEYLIATTAKRSQAGYERALELLQEGAMTYMEVDLNPQEFDGTNMEVSFDSLEPGAVWECPTTHERFIKTEFTEGFNCVRLSDGKLMNRVLEWGVIPHTQL